MSDNIFADAVKGPTELKTHKVTDHPPFFYDAIKADTLKKQASNMTRQQAFEAGLLTVEDMDDEELRCGRMRDGHGRIPKVTKTMENIPRDLYDAMVLEHNARTQENYRQMMDDALATIYEIMTDPSCEPKDRLDAAKHVKEQVMGKTPDKVQVTVAKAPWQELMGDVAKITRAQHLALKEGTIDVESFEVVDETPAEGRPEQHAEPDGPIDLRAATGGGPIGHVDNPDAQYVNVNVPNVGVPRGPLHSDEGRASNQRASTRPGHSDGDYTDQILEATTPFAPAPMAPNYLQPASSNPVDGPVSNSAPGHTSSSVVSPGPMQILPLSQQIRAAQTKAQDVAIARKLRKDIIASAKKRRIAKRAVGADVVARELVDVHYDGVQDKLLRATETAPIVEDEAP